MKMVLTKVDVVDGIVVVDAHLYTKLLFLHIYM